MARKKGKGSDSRGALLGAAWALMLEDGTAGMSVDAIVARAGLSKGTFFHFFPAKQDLLDALCERIADQAWLDIGGVLDRTDLDPVARFDRFLQASRGWKLERSRAMGVLWRELLRAENAALLRKVFALGVERTAPAIGRLIAEANDAGRMRVTDPAVMSRIVLEWLYATVEGNLRLIVERPDAGSLDMAARRANAAMEGMERVLGTPRGSFTRVDMEIIARLAADVPAAGEAGGGTSFRPAQGKGTDRRKDGVAGDRAGVSRKQARRRGGSHG